MNRNRRKFPKPRFTQALLLAAVALTTLALASPAVARPIVHRAVYPTTLSTPVMIVVLGVAFIAAVTLITGAVVAARPRRARQTSAAAQPQMLTVEKTRPQTVA
jgi:hypothetical protein